MFFLFSLFPIVGFGQSSDVVINEFCAKNDNLMFDVSNVKLQSVF